jgi:hypothetical protein
MLQVWSGVAQVTAALPGPGRVELFALRQAGAAGPVLRAEAYDAERLVAGGELAVWELNQALATLRSGTSQARRLAVRDGGHGGHLDLVCEGGAAALYATSRDDSRRVAFETTAEALATDLATVLRHYLALSRNGPPRTIVLPDALSPRVPAPR